MTTDLLCSDGAAPGRARVDEPLAGAPPLARAARRGVAATAVTASLTFLAAFAVLSSAINWPESLDLPPGEALPLVVAEREGLLLGYSLYLVYSLAFLPLAVLLPRALGLRAGPLVTAAVVVGAVSAVLRALGITRWLTAMPALSDTYVEAAPDSAAREAAGVAYTTLNDYAGAVGEVLGVSLAGGTWVLLLTVALAGHGAPRWLTGLGVLTAAVHAPAIAVGAFAAPATTLMLVWLVALALRLWTTPETGAGSAAAAAAEGPADGRDGQPVAAEGTR